MNSYSRAEPNFAVSFTADMIVDGIHEHYGVNLFRRSFLPLLYNGKYLIRYPAWAVKQADPAKAKEAEPKKAKSAVKKKSSEIAL